MIWFDTFSIIALVFFSVKYGYLVGKRIGKGKS